MEYVPAFWSAPRRLLTYSIIYLLPSPSPPPRRWNRQFYSNPSFPPSLNSTSTHNFLLHKLLRFKKKVRTPWPINLLIPWSDSEPSHPSPACYLPVAPVKSYPRETLVNLYTKVLHGLNLVNLRHSLVPPELHHPSTLYPDVLPTTPDEPLYKPTGTALNCQESC